MNYEESTSAMNKMFWDEFRPKAQALLGYVPTVYWPNTVVPNPAPTNEFWCRVSRKTIDERLAGFGEGGPSIRRYDVRCIYYVQMFYPHTDKWANKNLPKLAQFAKDSMQGKNDPTNVLWSREVKIDELDIEKAWFRSNIVAVFEYQEIKTPE